MIRAAALGLALAAAAPAEAGCRLALALALDVSASVDMEEYRLQLDGLARALNSPAVQAALLADPAAPVALAVYEWSGWAAQRPVLPWTDVTGPTVLARITAHLMATERQRMSNSTALGAALLHGADLLAQRPDCAAWVIDVSGDGTNNDGPDPDMLEGEGPLAAVTVNALVIGADPRRPGDSRAEALADLLGYFEQQVIRGPGAFVELALGYDEFEAAMTRKLLREIGALHLVAR